MLGPYSHMPLGPGPGGGGGGSSLTEEASGMDAAADVVGTIRCAGCGGTAGDYLGPPDLSNACSWCGGRLPLCDPCARAVSFSAIGESGGGGGGVTVDEMIAAEAVCCCACARLVCSGPECSTRCSNMSCEVCTCAVGPPLYLEFWVVWTVCCIVNRTSGVGRAGTTIYILLGDTTITKYETL